MRVLLLSAYDTPSHRYWCTSLQYHLSEFDWTYLTLPGRHFSWRIRGNSLTWSVREADVLAQSYDLVLATSMTDLATLRGLCPRLAQIPNILYFHENQFAYPRTALAHPSVEPQMVSLYAALAADCLVFNSDYNRRTFLEGVATLLRQLPDEIPPGIVDSLASKTSILPVPIDTFETLTSDIRSSQLPLEIIWNHRWEYDKGPDLLLAQVQSLPEEWQLRFHIVGQQFRKQPPEFELLHQLLRKRSWLGEWGFVSDGAAYQALLRRSHAVLSTAMHDFQGLAILEAVAAGCTPLVPNRLAYPEWFGEAVCYHESGPPGASLAAKICELQKAVGQRDLISGTDISEFYWSNMVSRYRHLLNRVAVAKHCG